jgi:hypothetical protein
MPLLILLSTAVAGAFFVIWLNLKLIKRKVLVGRGEMK